MRSCSLLEVDDFCQIPVLSPSQVLEQLQVDCVAGSGQALRASATAICMVSKYVLLLLYACILSQQILTTSLQDSCAAHQATSACLLAG